MTPTLISKGCSRGGWCRLETDRRGSGNLPAAGCEDPRARPLSIPVTPVPAQEYDRTHVPSRHPRRDDLILELARRVDDDHLEAKLRSPLARDLRVLALEVADRETIIRALEDPPTGLEELRATLLQEHAWRRREGL